MCSEISILFPLLLCCVLERHISPCSCTYRVSCIFPTLETGGSRQRVHIVTTYAATHISRLVVNPSSNRAPGPPKLRGSLFIIFLSFPFASLLFVQTHDAIYDNINPRLIVFSAQYVFLRQNE